MSLRLVGLSLSLWLSACSVSLAQAVQLPTFHVFSISTTVSVPDSGSAYLGGIKRGRLGSSTWGLPLLGGVAGGRALGDRGLGSEMGTSAASVAATIIDREEWDKAVLAEAAARRSASGPKGSATDRKAAFLTRNMAAGTAELPRSRDSVAEIRRRNRVAQPQREREALEFLEKAQRAEAKGNRAAAKIYYQMVARRTSGKLQQRVLSKLSALANPTDPKLAAAGSR